MIMQKIRMRTRRIVRSSIVLFVHLVHNLLVILHFLPKEIKNSYRGREIYVILSCIYQHSSVILYEFSNYLLIHISIPAGLR